MVIVSVQLNTKMDNITRKMKDEKNKENDEKYKFIDDIKSGYMDRILQTEDKMMQDMENVKTDRDLAIDKLNTEMLSFVADMRSELI